MESRDIEKKKGDAKKDANPTPNASSTSVLPHHIGGPTTSLPFFAESFLVWGLGISCLAVSGYHHGKSTLLSPSFYFNVYRSTRRLVRRTVGGWIGSLTQQQIKSNPDRDEENGATWIPLTTHSRAELDRESPWDRYQALLRVFEMCYPEVLAQLMPRENGCNGKVVENTENGDLPLKCNFDVDAALKRVLRHDHICRKLASLAMRPYDATIFPTTSDAKHQSTFSDTTTLLDQFPNNQLLNRMSKLWKQLLVLPSLEESKSYCRPRSTDAAPVAASKNKIHANDSNHPFRISLILPAYRENGSHLLKKLRRALDMTIDPTEVEVVIVDAGCCSDLEMVIALAENENNDRHWGQVNIFSFNSGGGRGPCLNFGASVATGRILSFCHSDTTLPKRWNESIASTLEHGVPFGNERSIQGIVRANSCAFSFGVDTSPEGLSMPFESSTKNYYPPGIKAVEFGVNLRSHICSLPYGDQVISLHACIFDFLGGFPDQCLMEDYDLVSLLKKRASLLSSTKSKEKVVIISGAPALCSPRRWQKFGVMYVAYMNHKFVRLYTGNAKMSPNYLFQLYYGREPPKRDSEDSPWEVEMGKLLEG